MAEGKTSMFGKTYNTIGSTDSNFIIKTKGDLKVQWGNKYIDIIKNGKVAASKADFIYRVSTEEDIKNTGIYITEDEQVWVNIDGTKINISGILGNSYVSFIEPQEIEDTTIALRNIGFYYETLESVNNVKNGIIYIENELSLYLVENGTLTKYSNSSSIQGTTNSEKGDLYIEGDSLYYKGYLYIQATPTTVTLNKPLIAKEGIESENATQLYGYRLYMLEGKSILEIDYLIVRNKEVSIQDAHYPLYSLKDNRASIIANSEGTINITLHYPNEYELGEFIYLLIDNKLYEYEIVKVEGQVISIVVDSSMAQKVVDGCDCIYLSRSPYIHVLKGNINLLDRSLTITDPDTLVTTISEYKHTIIGEIIEEELTIPEKSEERPRPGIFTDNLIAVNPILHNAIFKLYPEYHKETLSPTELLTDPKYDLTVPNILWIKLILDLYIPIGSIIMYNGESSIPEGWAICDGTNGTPDLVGKFIKADNKVGVNTPEGVSEDNTITIQEKHLPEHSHPHVEHGHTISDITASASSEYTLDGASSESAIVSVSGEGVSGSTGYSGDSTSSGSHTHTITINGGNIANTVSTEASKTWTNEAIKIEPHSYSLIFIMKIKNFGSLNNL